MSVHIGIIGAGSWGMAVARLLCLNGHRVTLAEPDAHEYEILQEHRGNPSRLPKFRLPEAVILSNDLQSVIESSDQIVLAIPSQYLRSFISRLSFSNRKPSAIVNLAKGLELKSLARMSTVIAEATSVSPEHVVTLSGPSHAEEVALDMPTTVVAAGINPEIVAQVQQIFSGSTFRVYASDDIIGVELGGSIKNIIAIASGIADGLGMGDNTRGALVTRGLAEMTRLGVAMGAKPETFAGLSGLGDLVTTCSSLHSRNRHVGERIGRGETLSAILGSMTMVAEGVDTSRAGRELASRHNIEMPITNEVCRVLFEQKSPKAAVADLMGRSLKPEVWQKESRGYTGDRHETCK
jgi:glycerol-3-phosphate dehydrogenase (NAD(P)+)